MKFLLTLLTIGFAFNLQAQKAKMRPLVDLINIKESAWTTYLQQAIKDAKNHVELLPKVKERADSALYKAQITTRSPMGAIVYETGGLLIDHGWIRILGSGHAKLDRNLMDWNQGKTYSKLGEQLPYLLVADDVVGGFFAINAGGLDSTGIGKVYYFAPDNLLWTCTNMTYSDFLSFCFCGDIKKFYETLYWTDWEKDISIINGNQGYFFFPYLCTEEGQDVNLDKKSIVPIEELWVFYNELRRKFVLKD